MTYLRVLASHPVQYHVPFYRALVGDGLDLEVGYYHAGMAGRKGYDREFGMDIQWDVELLEGYPYRIFLDGTATYSKLEQLRSLMPMVFWALRHRTPLLLMGWFIESIWLIWAMALFLRIPVVVMCETTPQSYSVTSKPRWRTALLGWLLRRTQSGLYIGSRNREFLSSMGMPDDRLFPVPYSIDNERFASEAKQFRVRRTDLCSRYGLDIELPVFLFCGKLIPKKRPLQLLEAYLSAGLADKAQLLFVGEGMLRPELERRVQALQLKNVHLAGFLNQSQMPLAYVLGEILCLISDATETWGLVVNEALTCGRPVIVSDSVGCAPDLVGVENGWAVPLDDHEKLAQTLAAAFLKYADWKNMGNAGRRRVAGNTFASMADGVVLALKSMAGQHVESGNM